MNLIHLVYIMELALFILIIILNTNQLFHKAHLKLKSMLSLNGGEQDHVYPFRKGWRRYLNVFHMDY